MRLSDRLQLGLVSGLEPEDLTALETAISQMVRAGVAVTFSDWCGFSPIERELLAEAQDKYRSLLAIMTGTAAHSEESALAAYAGVDGGDAIVRRRLQRIAVEVLGE